MKIKLLLITIFFLSLLAANFIFAVDDPGKIYSISSIYVQGSLRLAEVNLVSGYPNLSTNKDVFFNSEDIYELKLLSNNDEILYEGYFDVSNIYYPVPPENPGDLKPDEEVGPIELDVVSLVVSLPYFQDGQDIKISQEGKELLSIDVSRFQMYCGDGKCQTAVDETNQNCPQDCVESAGPPSPPVTPPEKGKGVTNYILYGVIIIVVIILAIFFIKKLTKKTPPFGKIEGSF